jgi:hypothetical protein
MDLGLKTKSCVMARFGFESLEDLGFRALRKLLEDYGLMFRF